MDEHSFRPGRVGSHPCDTSDTTHENLATPFLYGMFS